MQLYLQIQTNIRTDKHTLNHCAQP